MDLKEKISVKYPLLFTIEEIEEIKEEIEEIKEESIKKEIHERICNRLADHVRNNSNNYFFLNSEYKYQIYVKFFKELLNSEWDINEKIFVFVPGGWEEHEISELNNYKKLVNCQIEYKIYFSRKD